MPKVRIPKLAQKPKDFSRLPWTEKYRSSNPAELVVEQFKGAKIENWADNLFVEQGVERRKSFLLAETAQNLKTIVRNDNEVLLNINIPFCAWRCVNCQRIMYQKDKNIDVYPYYFEALIKDINLTREIIKKKCYIVKSICFTGNLLALDENRIEQILQSSAFAITETCIELGNPKFVTENKLKLLKKYNVSRVILNALTFNLVTLRKLCRRFDFKDVFDAYKLLTQFGFETSLEFAIGLPGEKEVQIGRNLSLAMELGASNINLYSRFCPHNPIGEVISTENEITKQRKLLEFAYEQLTQKGYKPYFLYCTEVENGCFENVGYQINEKKCKFQEDLVEEISTVIGCGTDTKSMIVKNLYHTKTYLKTTYDMGQYVLGIDEILGKKKKFFNLSN